MSKTRNQRKRGRVLLSLWISAVVFGILVATLLIAEVLLPSDEYHSPALSQNAAEVQKVIIIHRGRCTE